MSKRKKTPPMLADPKAVKQAAGVIESQILRMGQAMPEGLRDIFSRAAALELIYNGQARIEIRAKNRLNSQKEAEVWLANFLAAPLKAWRPFGVELASRYWHGNVFVVILKKK